jgi:acyl carrier protein phosphodiesterase
MNFLAHLFLSCEQDSLLVGNFMADFVRNKDLPQFTAPIVQGIHLHRQIDTFTDNHPLVRQGARRLHARHSKYAGVLIDLFYDYLLIEQWQRFSGESLERFTQRTYAVLESHIDIMPLSLQQRLPGMISGNWLMSYGHEDGLAYAIERMKNRVSRPAYLNESIQSLRDHHAELTKEFLAFFPDLIQYVEETCKC